MGLRQHCLCKRRLVYSTASLGFSQDIWHQFESARAIDSAEVGFSNLIRRENIRCVRKCYLSLSLVACLIFVSQLVMSPHTFIIMRVL